MKEEVELEVLAGRSRFEVVMDIDKIWLHQVEEDVDEDVELRRGIKFDLVFEV